MTREPAPSSLAPTAENRWVDMSSLMRRPLESCFGKVEGKSGWRRYRTHQVRENDVVVVDMMVTLFPPTLISPSLDCPEGEATYVITQGGIADPEKT